jgi:hypothetical protein
MTENNPRHFIGKMCPHAGHGNKRFRSDGTCVVCARERVRARRARVVSNQARYRGKICQLHPKLRGLRYRLGSRCVACAKERTARGRAVERLTRVPKRTPARKQALATGAKTYVGKICPRGHDDGGGSVRYAISGCCVKCVMDKSRHRLTAEGRAHVRELERARERRKTLALQLVKHLGISL